MSSTKLSVGIVGLPNVGKSTLFNALMKRSVSAEGNYPFTTIKPCTGVVKVPDRRLESLAKIVVGPAALFSHPTSSPALRALDGSPSSAPPTTVPKIVPATVTFVDIAGLVKNAHKGEGLGNEFLGQIRNVDAIVHVIRNFFDDDVVHVEGNIDPKRDKEIIEIELELGGIKKPMIEWVNSDIEDFDKVDELIGDAYKLLDLITFYTIKPSFAKASEGQGAGQIISAWGIKKGSSILEAAEKVHTDFRRNFIKAEVINVDELLELGSWKNAKEKGRIRLEGKNYIMQNGDVVEFLISK